MDATQLRKDTEASVEDSPEHEQKHPQFTDGVMEKLEMFTNISQHLFHGLQYYWISAHRWRLSEVVLQPSYIQIFSLGC